MSYTNEQLKELYPFAGGVELARAAIDHYGDAIIDSITPIYIAICSVQGWNDTPCLAVLAEAIQYKDVETLRYMAETGLYRTDPQGTEPSTGIMNRCRIIAGNL